MGKICVGIISTVKAIFEGKLNLNDIDIIFHDEVLHGENLLREENVDDFFYRHTPNWSSIIRSAAKLSQNYDEQFREKFDEISPLIKKLILQFYKDKKIKHLVTRTPEVEQLTYKNWDLGEHRDEDRDPGGIFAINFNKDVDKFDANTEYYYADYDPFIGSFDIFQHGEKNIYDSPVEFIATQLLLTSSSFDKLKIGTYLSKLFPEYEKGIIEICDKHKDRC